MAKRLNKKKPAKPAAGRKPSGVLAAAAQDVELIVEEVEKVAKETVRKAATEIVKLGDVRGGPPLPAVLPEDKRFETRRKPPKPRLRKKLD
jgi:hypothetical protein